MSESRAGIRKALAERELDLELAQDARGRARFRAAPATPPKRAAIYARVSTTDQDPEAQLLELRELAGARGWTVAGEHVDHGVSGARDRRPALDELLENVRAEKVDVVIAWSLDRLGRSLTHLLALAQELEQLQVDLVLKAQPVDTTTPAGKLVFQVLGAVAQFERELIRERVRSGIAKARASGKVLGRPRRASREQIERARALRAKGTSWRKVAMSVGVPLTTIREAVDDEA